VANPLPTGPTLTIQAHGVSPDDFWWAWITGLNRPLRQVRSIEEVRGIMGEFECSHVVWPDGSYEEMVRSEVAPADPPEWLI
jgi:hypothetical protein